MDWHFIWDAIATLAVITMVLVALMAMTWWSVSEALRVAKRFAYPHLGRWARRRKRRMEEWRATKRR
jgi:hypothetical protein